MKFLHNKSLLTITFTLLLAVAVFSTIKFTNVNARSSSDAHRYLYYTNIEIKQGDTLTDIAKKYMTPEYSSVSEYVKEIKKFNGLSDDNIYAGQYLVIMYYSSDLK